MQSQEDDPGLLSVRTLLESTGTPFTVTGYAQHSVIFLQGDPCDSLMQVEKGRVRLGMTTPAGKEAIYSLVGAGAFLGEEVLGRYAVRRQTAIALTATEVLVVSKVQMTRLLHTHRPMADRFIGHLLARNTRLQADLADQLLHFAEQRLARALLGLAGFDERRPCRCPLPEVSQEIIAAMIGAARSRVNALMCKFKSRGLIDEERGALHVNPSLLHVALQGRRVSNGTPPASPQASRSKTRTRPRRPRAPARRSREPRLQDSEAPASSTC